MPDRRELPIGLVAALASELGWLAEMASPPDQIAVHAAGTTWQHFDDEICFDVCPYCLGETSSSDLAVALCFRWPHSKMGDEPLWMCSPAWMHKDCHDRCDLLPTKSSIREGCTSS